MPPKCLINGVRESIEKYQKEQVLSSPIGPREHTTQAIWRPPSDDSFKVNWDESIDRRKNLMGVGVIVCDLARTVLVAQCSVQKYILDPTTAEVIGAKMGAKLERDLGLHSIILEANARAVITTLNQEDEDLSGFGSVIVETREFLKGFSLWDVSFVRREGNSAAHQLAKPAVN